MTKQRELILNIVTQSCGHLTAEEVYKIAREKMPSIALGTVYRNLGKLCEDKKIKLISMRGFPDCYDKTVVPHGHLICDICGKVSDFSIPDISSKLESDLKVTLTSYDLNAHYICDCCKQGDY